MKTKLIERRKVIKISCYRETKFADSADDPGWIKKMKSEKRECIFGFDKIIPACQECRWFYMQKIDDGFGRALIVDREIENVDIDKLINEYSKMDTIMISESLKEDSGGR